MIRNFFKHILESLKNLKRNGWMTVAAVSSVTITLALVGLFLSIILNTQRLTKGIENNVRIVAYMKLDVHDQEAKIQQWIREERLEFTADSPVKIPCENCGEMIRSGKYCDKCKREMTNNLSSVMEKPKAARAEPKKTQPSGNKMRFLDR